MGKAEILFIHGTLILFIKEDFLGIYSPYIVLMRYKS